MIWVVVGMLTALKALLADYLAVFKSCHRGSWQDGLFTNEEIQLSCLS